MNRNRWVAVAAGLLVAFAVVNAWPELRRYRRMRAM
jgi:uncharacterized membrane-anchored protein